MLLPREQSPWNCAYFLGATALEVLKRSPNGKCDLPDLQQGMSAFLERSVSGTQALIAAAWLYLIDAIKLDEQGMITRCN